MKILNRLILATLMLSSACTRYLDEDNKSNNKITTKDFELNILENKNIFIYTSNLTTRRDDEVILTTKFKLDLPKNIINFKISNMYKFVFNYPNKQYFIIYTDNEKKSLVTNDTLYIPDEKEIEALIQQNGVHIIKKIKRDKSIGRKYLIFKKGNTTILLYNIKNDNIDTFVNCAKSLNFF